MLRVALRLRQRSRSLTCVLFVNGNLLLTHTNTHTKANASMQSITINGEIPVAKLRDGQTAMLDLSSRNYKDADVIIIASLLKVRSWVCAHIYCNVGV